MENLDSTAEELCKYNPYLEDESIVGDIKNAYDAYFESVDAMTDRNTDDYEYSITFNSQRMPGR